MPAVERLVRSVQSRIDGRHRRALPVPEPPALPRFVMGTGELHRLYVRRSPRPYVRTDAVLDDALAAGLVAFDTAAAYGMGTSERALGHFIRTRRIRDRIVVISKGGLPHPSGSSRLDRSSLTSDVDGSLARLRVDALDLFMLHRDDPARPVGPIMQALHGLVQAGKVRAIGASNWTHERIAAANDVAILHGLTPFTASSPHLSLAEWVEPPWPGCTSIAGAAHEPARQWYARSGMPVLAWSPLGGGFLAGREPIDPSAARSYRSARNVERRDRLTRLAGDKGVDPAPLALAYVMGLGLDVHPIVYASTPGRLAALVAAAELTLAPDELAWLEQPAEPPADDAERAPA